MNSCPAGNSGVTNFRSRPGESEQAAVGVEAGVGGELHEDRRLPRRRRPRRLWPAGRRPAFRAVGTRRDLGRRVWDRRGGPARCPDMRRGRGVGAVGQRLGSVQRPARRSTEYDAEPKHEYAAPVAAGRRTRCRNRRSNPPAARTDRRTRLHAMPLNHALAADAPAATPAGYRRAGAAVCIAGRSRAHPAGAADDPRQPTAVEQVAEVPVELRPSGAAVIAVIRTRLYMVRPPESRGTPG